MTDEEIIKALEKRIESTKNIKYGVNKMTMIDAQFLIDILDFINRLQAENEKLKEALHECHKHEVLGCTK